VEVAAVVAVEVAVVVGGVGSPGLSVNIRALKMTKTTPIFWTTTTI